MQLVTFVPEDYGTIKGNNFLMMPNVQKMQPLDLWLLQFVVFTEILENANQGSIQCYRSLPNLSSHLKLAFEMQLNASMVFNFRKETLCLCDAIIARG